MTWDNAEVQALAAQLYEILADYNIPSSLALLALDETIRLVESDSFSEPEPIEEFPDDIDEQTPDSE